MVLDEYLKELDLQEVRNEKKIQVVRNRTVDALCKTYELAVKKILKYGHIDDTPFCKYGFCRDTIGRAIYTTKDVTNFSVRLKEYEKQEEFSEHAGIFLSALINNAEGEGVEIITKHLSKPIHYLGYRAEKDITVIGDLGSCTGVEMSYGVIINVEGSVQDDTGRDMHNGIIIVEKNAGTNTGNRAEGGTIYVKGNTGNWTGFNLNGGKVIVYGNSGNCTGQLLQKGSIIICGDAGDSTGNYVRNGIIEIRGSAGKRVGVDSSGGEIHVGGRIKGFARKNSKCKIFRRGKRIR